MKRLQTIGIESEVVTKLEALGVGHECLLKYAKPSSIRARQALTSMLNQVDSNLIW